MSITGMWGRASGLSEGIPGALDAIRLLTESGRHVFVVTNQSGVARGFYDEAAVRSLLAWMADEAGRNGGTIDDARYCPHHPGAGSAPYRQACACRKPEPGMLLDLIRAWDVRSEGSFMIGDEVGPGGGAGCRGAGVFVRRRRSGSIRSRCGCARNGLERCAAGRETAHACQSEAASRTGTMEAPASCRAAISCSRWEAAARKTRWPPPAPHSVTPSA